MQLSFPFCTLLAGVLVALNAAAAPAQQPRMVTLPLTRIPQRSDAHPQILLQQQMNSAHKRLALMAGVAPPTGRALYAALHKRVLAVEGAAGVERRYNRWGYPAKTDKRFNRTGLTHERRAKKGRKGQAGANNGAAQQPAGAIGGPDSAVDGVVAVANAPTAANSLGLNVEVPDVGYLATVQMGTPPQNFLILMDSGSADLWVASDTCQGVDGGGCGRHQTLSSRSSSSFKASDTPFTVTYGTGAVAGAIVQDDITVAGLTLKAHTFGVATQETDDFANDRVPFDGLMGLAKSALSQQKTATPVEALAQQGLISDAITSYKISRTADAKNDGEITFGALDPAKFDANTLVTVPNVNAQGFWEAALDGVSVNGQDLGLNGRTAILDTGTTLVVVPQADAAAIHAGIKGAQDAGNGQFVVPCDLTDAVAFTFGGATFAIDPRDIAVQPVDNTGTTCISGITGGSFGTSDTQFLVGDVFLKNAYYSTDVGKNAISLAKLV
ncbi:Acid protease [Mycena indigotica]|uniref:Acid protease n=1 Tax=Mycena indigotica TaxID=2126181 RepID=A0A8H6S4H4_9AGAR|nr:Acid protease [Mycena indigotica]KAF7292744.1 Acid protease [Mycena indigotica]